MFTGIVQDIGTIDTIIRSKGGLIMRIKTLFKDEVLAEGESINVNGACLTVEKAEHLSFQAYVSGETMARSNLASLKKGDRVNLERAMKAGDRFGGHIVQGHIDSTGTVRKIARRGGDVILRVSHPASLEGLFVEKGSVALDGVSLTVSGIGKGWIEVNQVPYTLANTTLRKLRMGQKLNIEADILGKYAQRSRESKK